MGPYYWTIGLVAVFSFFAENCSNSTIGEELPLRKESVPTKVLLLLTAGILIFVAGCRYGVGLDYFSYYNGVKAYGDKFLKSVRTFDEPGFKLLAAIVAGLSEDGAAFIFSCALITISLILFTAYKYEQSYLLVSLLFITTGIWDGSFNGVRQFLAAAVLFAGHRFILDRKLWKYALIVLLASSIHKSAVVMFALFFFLRNRITMRNVLLLAIGTAIITINYDTVFRFIGLLKDSDYSTLDNYAKTTVNIMRIIVACSPAVACMILNHDKELTKEQTFYINAMIIHGAAMVATSNSAYLARISIYTSPFIIIAIPKLVRLENKRLEALFRVGIVALYAVYWYIGISGSSSLNHFRWIWER